MKQITAIIQPHMLEAVDHALHQLRHFPGFTVWRCRGESRGSEPGYAWHASGSDLAGHADVLLLIACTDELAPAIVQTIRQHARTGHGGDGVITVVTLDDVVRIGSEEHGDSAV